MSAISTLKVTYHAGHIPGALRKKLGVLFAQAYQDYTGDRGANFKTEFMRWQPEEYAIPFGFDDFVFSAEQDNNPYAKAGAQCVLEIFGQAVNLPEETQDGLAAAIIQIADDCFTCPRAGSPAIQLAFIPDPRFALIP